jgi:hypothetical protein
MKRRLSDPPPYSKENKKSIHYKSSKLSVLDLTALKDTLGKGGQDSDSDSRKTVTFPVSPNR